MGWPVVSGALGLPVIDVSLTTKVGMPVTEAANGFGVPVIKVTAFGLPVVYVSPPLQARTFRDKQHDEMENAGLKRAGYERLNDGPIDRGRAR
jgi:hypothetical protein